jgi:hypothetical protein
MVPLQKMGAVTGVRVEPSASLSDSNPSIVTDLQWQGREEKRKLNLTGETIVCVKIIIPPSECYQIFCINISPNHSMNHHRSKKPGYVDGSGRPDEYKVSPLISLLAVAVSGIPEIQF